MNKCMDINFEKFVKKFDLLEKDFLIKFGNLLLEESIFLEERKQLYNKLLTNTNIDINQYINLQKDQEQFDTTLQHYVTLSQLQGQTKPVKELKEEKLRKEIYEKVKKSGVKASKKRLKDMGYTETQLRSIKIKMINFEIFGK